MDSETREANHGTGFKNDRETMTCTEEKNDDRQMARMMVEKIDKGPQLLPKKVEEEGTSHKEEEEANAPEKMETSELAYFLYLAKLVNIQLNGTSPKMNENRGSVLRTCRKTSTEEKRKLRAGLGRLSPEALDRALKLIAQTEPSFVDTAEEVDLDMDALSESTLWRLKFFLKRQFECRSRPMRRVPNIIPNVREGPEMGMPRQP